MGCTLNKEIILLEYTYQEVRKHNNQHDCWIIVGKYIYDVTSFLDLHPGSSNAILQNSGDICDHHFKFHSKTACEMLVKYKIGKIKDI